MELNQLNNSGKKKIVIAGQSVEVDENAKVADTLKSLLESRGIDSFTIIVDGGEVIDTLGLPETFAQCETLEVERYAKPGIC